MNNRVVSNVLATLAAQLGSWALTLVVTLYLPSYLGTERLGALSLVGAFIAMVGPYASAGTGTLLVYRVARHPETTRELAYTVVWTRLFMSVGVLALGMIATYVLRYDPQQRLLIFLGLLSLVVMIPADVLSQVLRGREEMVYSNAAGMVDRILNVLLTLVGIRTGRGLVYFSALPYATAPVTLIMLASRTRDLFRPVIGPQGRAIRECLIHSLPFLMGGILFTIWEPGNKLLLNQFGGKTALSWYDLTKRLGGSAMFIPVAVGSAILPALSRQFATAPEKFTQGIWQLCRLMILCAVPICSVMLLAPATLISLYRDPSFLGAVTPLRLMGVGILVWYLSQIIVQALIASGNQVAFGRITTQVAVICVPICAACIYTAQRFAHNGAAGAMVADILIEVYMLACYTRALPFAFPWGRTFSLLLRALVASAPLGASLLLAHSIRQLWILIPGLAVYAALCLLFRCIDRDDLALLRQLVHDRLARKVAA